MNCEGCGHPNIDGARFCAKCGAVLPVQDEAAEDKMIGQVIGGRYRVTGVLGEGGMGVVYVGEQQMGSTIRKVAIKTLHPHLSKDPSVLARFHRECGTVAQLEHPNTIKFYDFGATADGTLYIAMEFVKGQPLSEVIEKGGPLAADRVLKILKQACGALDEAHRQGIIHRDLKPDNLILTDRAGETDFVKVLDFGIAARTESADAQKEQKLTQQGMVLGTPPYMSPEQFTGKQLDARSDVYSLGVMAYEMLTGKLPFEADTPWQWATQHMTAQPLPFEVTAPSTSIPPQMRAGILRALSKNRDERQGTTKEFYEQVSGGGGITVMDAQPVSLGSAGTAAMAAAPDFNAFGGAPAPAAAPPVMMAAPPPNPPALAAPIPPPPPMTRGGGGGGGKGLVIGLGAIGAVLLIGMIVVAAVKFKPEEDDQPLTNPFGSSSGQTTITPQVDTGTAPTGSAETPPTDSGEKPATTATPTRTSTSTAPTGTGTGTAGGSSAAACDQCNAAARSGAIQAAAGAYRRCNDAGKKAACTAQANRSAPGAARAAALNGNCAQAKGIIAAANAMGAGSGGLNNALKGTKCQ